MPCNVKNRIESDSKCDLCPSPSVQSSECVPCMKKPSPITLKKSNSFNKEASQCQSIPQSEISSISEILSDNESASGSYQCSTNSKYSKDQNYSAFNDSLRKTRISTLPRTSSNRNFDLTESTKSKIEPNDSKKYLSFQSDEFNTKSENSFKETKKISSIDSWSAYTNNSVIITNTEISCDEDFDDELEETSREYSQSSSSCGSNRSKKIEMKIKTDIM